VIVLLQSELARDAICKYVIFARTATLKDSNHRYEEGRTPLSRKIPIIWVRGKI